MGSRFIGGALVAALLLLGCATGGPTDDSLGAEAVRAENTYNKDTVLEEAEAWMGKGAAGLGALVEKAFREQGEPTAFIAGEEGAGAFIAGLRYGHGTFKMRDGVERKVYWQGPSIGFDYGGNGAKVFILIYNLTDPERLFMRYPGVDGSLYFVGGAGMNYNQRDAIILAPIRLGVGWRQGINVGYLNISPNLRYIPF